MFSRLATRASPAGLALCRDLLALARRNQSLINPSAGPALVGLYHSFATSSSKGIGKQEAQLNQMYSSRFPFQHRNMSSSTASAEFSSDKETFRSGNEHDTDSERFPTTETETVAFEDAKISDEKFDTGSRVELDSNRGSGVSATTKEKGVFSKWFKFSDSDTTSKLSRDELLTLVREKEEEFQKMQDKSLRTYAEMQNSMARTRREAENLKRFAIQDFAKRLLDVADNLERATSVVKTDLSKIEESKADASLQPLKTLMQGVEMTEKQLAEVFKKYGVVKYDALNEEFDPHKHNAVFQVPDPSKRPGTVAHVLKSGYMLHDRIIRPAEVGVAQAVEERDAEQSFAS